MERQQIKQVRVDSVQQKEKIGVLLLNLGGPETLEDVQPFLFNLFNDDSIIRLPSQSECTWLAAAFEQLCNSEI